MEILRWNNSPPIKCGKNYSKSATGGTFTKPFPHCYECHDWDQQEKIDWYYPTT